MNYTKLRKRESQFESVTSLKIAEFDALLPVFKDRFERSLRYTTRGAPRLNQLEYPDGLPDAEYALLFILSYLKLNPLQEHHGASFGMSQESVSRWYKVTLKALNDTLKKMGHSPVRQGNKLPDEVKKKANSEEGHCFIDVSDISIQRPNGKNEKQLAKYSGKHHSHTVKNTYVCDETTRINYLGPTTDGSVHDKRMADEEEISYPNDYFLWKDLGYVGYLPENIQCFEPFKKPKNAELTKFQKLENQAIASVRIIVEHAIGGVKRCRIIKGTIRIHSMKIRDRVIETCSALHNFRISLRPPYLINKLLF